MVSQALSLIDSWRRHPPMGLLVRGIAVGMGLKLDEPAGESRRQASAEQFAAAMGASVSRGKPTDPVWEGW